MRKTIVIITTLLIFAPLGMLLYKSQVLNLSLLPQMVDDVWNFHLTARPKGDKTSFSFPIPKPGPGIKISDERIRSKNFEVFIDSNSDSTLATWSAKEPIKQRVTYSARIDLKPLSYKNIPKDYTEVYPKGLNRYLKVPNLLPEDVAAIDHLEKAILEGNEDKTGVIRKIYYYVEEEIQRHTNIKTIHETLNTGKGSPLIKARLFNIMARRQKVPSRIVVMVRMPKKENAEHQKLSFTFANEVFLNNKWIPIDTNRGFFGERPDNFMVLHRNYEEVEKIISKKKVSYAIQAERARINRYNKAEFKKEVVKSDSIFSRFSLYRLPLPLQTMFTTILLIPVGTLVLSLARNIIGIPTFGIFTPILLTLFFKETSFGFGLLFFSVVVAIGIGQRYVLDKFYLLAVPRLSIILTLVIMLMIGYSLFSTDIAFVSQKHLAFFPIVIVTTNIERLSIMITEEGVWNTLKTLFGTLVISILGYSLYSIHALEMFMFTNPELLFTIIGLLILIGKYKGYRLSEFLRFRDLVRQKKKLESASNDLP
jgi:7 transmembrane helices usually fused to an inactive transglutaminase/Transglutaminase-like superfamily/Inactive transglutaminase fused to 7 transmembrane helices